MISAGQDDHRRDRDDHRRGLEEGRHRRAHAGEEHVVRPDDEGQEAEARSASTTSDW